MRLRKYFAFLAIVTLNSTGYCNASERLTHVWSLKVEDNRPKLIQNSFPAIDEHLPESDRRFPIDCLKVNITIKVDTAHDEQRLRLWGGDPFVVPVYINPDGSIQRVVRELPASIVSRGGPTAETRFLVADGTAKTAQGLEHSTSIALSQENLDGFVWWETSPNREFSVMYFRTKTIFLNYETSEIIAEYPARLYDVVFAKSADIFAGVTGEFMQSSRIVVFNFDGQIVYEGNNEFVFKTNLFPTPNGKGLYYNQVPEPGSHTREAFYWDFETGERIELTGLLKAPWYFSEDGKHVLVLDNYSGETQYIKSDEKTNVIELWRGVVASRMLTGAVSPDGSFVAVQSDVNDGCLTRVFDKNKNQIGQVASKNMGVQFIGNLLFVGKQWLPSSAVIGSVPDGQIDVYLVK
jgi:hypothetical protein